MSHVTDAVQLAALIGATALVVAGLTAALRRHVSTPQRLVGPARHLLEAAVPAFGAIVLLAAVWLWRP